MSLEESSEIPSDSRPTSQPESLYEWLTRCREWASRPAAMCAALKFGEIVTVELHEMPVTHPEGCDYVGFALAQGGGRPSV